MAYEEIIGTSDDVREMESNEAAEPAEKAVYNLPVSETNLIVREKLAEWNDSAKDIYESRESIREITELVQESLAQNSQQGTADDWHNFAVDVARKDLYDLTCDILEKGLELFPKNTDLLADYLQYGTACGRIEQCKRYYKILAKIPKIRYTWRAYSFSVNWLRYLWEQSDSEKEMEKLQKDMQTLVAAFRENIPDDEESYRCEADMFRLVQNRAGEERVLRSALSELKVAPKCALRLADILFDRGEYEDALKQIQRGIDDTIQTQASVNEGYMYYLRGLANIAVLVREKKTFDEASITSIYADFNTALSLMGERDAYRRTIKTKTKVLANESGVPVDDTYQELQYCIE